MLSPNNNYYLYQGPPSRNNYTFDLKLNVDFNNGRVGLGLPYNAPPFEKTHQVPAIYAQPTYVKPVSNYPVVVNRNQPVIHQIPSVWQPVPQYARLQPSNKYQSFNNPQAVEQSYYIGYSQKQKERSSNDTYQETSFSMGIQKSVEAVVCVICDKPINRDQFHKHIEEHKKRRLEYGSKEERHFQEQQKVNSFSVRNQNTLDNLAEIYRQPPSQSFQKNRILEDNGSRLENSRNVSRSRYIEDTQSRIVYAPAHILNTLNADHPSRVAYNSFGSRQNQQIEIRSNDNSRTVKAASTSQGNSLVQNSSLYYQGDLSNKVSKVGSMISLNSGLMKQQEVRRLSQNKQISHNYHQDNSRNSSLVRNARQQNNSNNYLDGTSSRVVHKQKQPSFKDIEQSVIHRINDHSLDFSMLELKKQLDIQHIEEESSSDEQPVYLSVKPSLPTKIHQSVSRSKHSLGMTSSSNMTQKLNRKKMPKNYLAREQFIVNTSLTRSYFKSRHSIWK